MKCQLLMSGNELMTGVTVDSNSAFIADKLTEIGIVVIKKVTVGDNLPQLEAEIHQAATQTDLLIINGGLGPTVDDLTAQALANVCKQKLVSHPEAEHHVQQWCQQRNVLVNTANLKQALLPENASVIPNSMGSAVGISINLQTNGRNCLILCTPGVPVEMRLMMEQEIIPLLITTFRDCREQFIRRLQVFGIGESTIQQKINTEIPDWPEDISLGFRAGMPTLEVKLTTHSQDHLPLRDVYENKLRNMLGSTIFGEENDTLASVVVRILMDKQKKITLAESCTGGLIASMLTAIPGSSLVFDAGFVTYSNSIKHSVLDVNLQTLQDHGAVSEAVVIQMANGALDKSAADYVIAVSGIAGPDGGTADKPVGTVWLAWGKSGHIKTHNFFYPAERKTFQALIAAYGLDLIRREILEITETPRYLKN